jgi:hypothetical protein
MANIATLRVVESPSRPGNALVKK